MMIRTTGIRDSSRARAASNVSYCPPHSSRYPGGSGTSRFDSLFRMRKQGSQIDTADVEADHQATLVLPWESGSARWKTIHQRLDPAVPFRHLEVAMECIQGRRFRKGITESQDDGKPYRTFIRRAIKTAADCLYRRQNFVWQQTGLVGFDRARTDFDKRHGRWGQHADIFGARFRVSHDLATWWSPVARSGQIVSVHADHYVGDSTSQDFVEAHLNRLGKRRAPLPGSSSCSTVSISRISCSRAR